MTSNAEDQANPPAAATLEPPKAAKRANVSPQKRGVAPTKLKMCKAARPAASGPNAKRLPNRPRPAAECPRGRQGGQGLGPVEGGPGGASLKEVMKTMGRLAHSVRGCLSGTVAQKMGQARVREGRRQGSAPTRSNSRSSRVFKFRRTGTPLSG